MRALLDLTASTQPPDDVVSDAADRLEEVAAMLRPHRVAENAAPAGARLDLPGRGHPMLIPLVVDSWTDDEAHARVTFRRAHVGGGGAAHGGTVALLFDDVLGRLANTGRRTPARTAYLHVNYRAVTPIDVELRVEATVDREEGRKRYATCRLFRGDVLVADAEGLFVQLLPGQP